MHPLVQVEFLSVHVPVRVDDPHVAVAVPNASAELRLLFTEAIQPEATAIMALAATRLTDEPAGWTGNQWLGLAIARLMPAVPR